MKINTIFKPVQTVLKDKGLDAGGRVQKVVDSEVLRRSDKYVPFRSGFLKKSGVLGTKIGSGEVDYTAIYADKNYYHNAGRGKQGTASGGLRGKEWFERMKADNLKDIVNAAKNSVGGK